MQMRSGHLQGVHGCTRVPRGLLPHSVEEGLGTEQLRQPDRFGQKGRGLGLCHQRDTPPHSSSKGGVEDGTIDIMDTYQSRRGHAPSTYTGPSRAL